MITAFFMTMIVCQTSEQVVEKEALRVAPSFVDKALKAPSTAKYSIRNVVLLDPDPIRARHRFRVEGSVDAQNSFGVPLRSNWNAVVAIIDDKPEILGFVWLTEDKIHDLYTAPVTKQYRKEFQVQVKKEFEERIKKTRERRDVSLKTANTKKAKLEVEKKYKEYIAWGVKDISNKYNVPIEDVLELLD